MSILTSSLINSTRPASEGRRHDGCFRTVRIGPSSTRFGRCRIEHPCHIASYHVALLSGTSSVSAPSRGSGGGGFDAVAARRKPLNKDEIIVIKDEIGEAMEIDGQFEDDSADVGFDPADIWSPVSLGGPQHLMKKEEPKKEKKIKSGCD